MIITRRNALKLGITAFLTSLASNATARKLTGTKVVVIGAGLAGLAAAKQLQERGAKVIVLEAGDYVGGRIRTDMSLGAPFEFGAGWIHGPSQHNPVKQLADALDVGTFVTDDDNLEVFDLSGRPLTDAEYVRLDDMYDRLETVLYSPARSETRSVHDLLREIEPDILTDPLGIWALSTFFEFDIGAGIEDISARNGFASETFDGADVIVTEGYDQVITPLAADLDIRLNTPVSRVYYDRNGVEIDGLQADYVVCAVPLGILKTGDIVFEPSLPEDVQKSIDRIGFGSVTKIALKFDTAFWDTETQYFGVMTEPRGRWNYWLNYRTFSDENILLGLSFGRYAPIADNMSKEVMTRDALAVIRSVWGDEVTSPQSVLTTHWSKEPHFRGAYSFPRTGGSVADFTRLETPISGRLFMAGEHTNFDYHGTTHGALMSGRRAANDILNA
ncbi:monoamine oxidase [Labrenzia sp. EL_126]|nr:monoamine oxidase [Labrenzia sp. EL_126]